MDQAATERVIRILSAYQEPLYRYIFALLPHEQDAKDVVQETCVALCRKFDEYDEARPFLPWAFRFAYLEVLKFRQKQRRHAISLSEGLLQQLAHERDEQRELLDARLQALDLCLRDLPEADTELIRGRYQSASSVEQLASRLGMSQRTLFRNLQRIRRVLFNCISRRVTAEGIG